MPREPAAVRPPHVQTQTRTTDRLIAELGGRQHGVVARGQLLGLGIGREAIAGRLARGNLHRLYPGVYAIGHTAVPREGRWMAAVLAGGENAVLSHRSAAVLWGLLKPVPGRIDLTVPRSTRSYGALRRHCGRLLPDEITTRDGIPVTTVSRTLLDFAAEVRPWEFERALREAEVLRLPQLPPLAELLARCPRRRGAHTVRTTLERLSCLPGGVTRSSLEDRFLRFIARSGLPLPEANVGVKVGSRHFEADCLWREQRLIVELDGHEVHGTRAAFESDRDKDRHLQAAGWTVVRITWRQLSDGTTLAADLHQLLDVPSHESASMRPLHVPAQFRA